MHYVKWSLAGLVGLAGLTLALQAQVPGEPAPKSLNASIAAAAREKEATVERVLRALGPAIATRIRAGVSQVELPGLGVLRVVRIGEYRDLGENGRPITVPERSFVELVSSEELNAAAASETAVPARTVQGFEFRPRAGSAAEGNVPTPRLPETRIGNDKIR